MWLPANFTCGAGASAWDTQNPCAEINKYCQPNPAYHLGPSGEVVGPNGTVDLNVA